MACSAAARSAPRDCCEMRKTWRAGGTAQGIARDARVALAGALLALRDRCEAGPAPADGRGYPLRIEPVVMTPQLLGAVIYVFVGDAEYFEIDARAALRKKFTHRRAEPSGDHMLFDRHEPRDARGE